MVVLPYNLIHIQKPFTYIAYLLCRIKAKMRTVEQIMIEGDDVEIGSDSDVSDTSQISCFSYKTLW